MKGTSRGGFMLIEMMITLSILAGLLTMFAMSLRAVEHDRELHAHLDVVQPDGTGRVISRRIRSIVIDDAASTGFTIPLQALRITVYFDRDPDRPNLPPGSLQTSLLLSRDNLLP